MRNCAVKQSVLLNKFEKITTTFIHKGIYSVVIFLIFDKTSYVNSNMPQLHISNPK